jgi:hypothetical protein
MPTPDRKSRRTLRAACAALVLALAACQGSGFDSGGMGGMGGGMGDMGPPVGNPGPMGTPGGMQGPELGPNGQPELTLPGATLAPNEAQYPVGDGPTGMKCPQVAIQMQQYTCSISFNLPPPTPTPSPGASANPKAKASPKPTPSPTPTPASSPGDATSPSPSPTPPGTVTLQVEALPKDVPPMTNPDPRALHVTPLVALRLQSDTDFALDGWAAVQYVLPRQQLPSRGFAIQLYNEGVVRGKRTDQFLATYDRYDANDQTIRFLFPTPKITVKRGQIWLLALYGLTYPPHSTPTPSPSPASTAQASPAAGAASPSPSASPSPAPTPS